jgi:hypothetical protein
VGYRLVTLNLNGIRSAASKGFVDWATTVGADCMGVQEIKAQAEHVVGPFDRVAGLRGHFHYAQRKGYSGVGLYTKKVPSDVITGFDGGEFDGEGRWVENFGGYDDWQRVKAARDAERAAAKSAATKIEKAERNDAADKAKPTRKARLSYKDQRELDTLPVRLAALEAEQAALNARLADSTLYATNPPEAAKAAARLAAIDADLTGLLERWEALEALQAGE